MGLDENAKAANVVGSIQQYFEDQLATVLNSSAAAIDYGGGQPFKDSSLAEWIQVRVLEPARPDLLEGPFAGRASGSASPDARGQEMFWLVNINCFVRPAKLVPFTNLRTWQLRDTVLEPFKVGTRIPVKDFADSTSTGGETIGYLFSYRLLSDRPVYDPEREDLIQHNLVVALRWTETWVN
ncbi:MAG TPA: hypothetical protein VLA89_17870 [Gemmatimonadales bacterium]|nr:hypothetical protein [Gemmatimonadales bacterium]